MGAPQSHSERRKLPTALPFVTTPPKELYLETEENQNEQGRETNWDTDQSGERVV